MTDSYAALGVTPPVPCRACGGVEDHRPDCPTDAPKRVARRKLLQDELDRVVRDDVDGDRDG